MKLLKLGGMKRTMLAVCFQLFLTSSLAHAALGGDASTADLDAKILATAKTVSRHGKYTIHEMNERSVRIREFQNSSNSLFAVSWRGSTHPDLKTLLGAHYETFQNAYGAAKKNHPHGGMMIGEVGNLHFEIGGRMMAVHGRVWLKDQVPSGMDLHEVN